MSNERAAWVSADADSLHTRERDFAQIFQSYTAGSFKFDVRREFISQGHCRRQLIGRHVIEHDDVGLGGQHSV